MSARKFVPYANESDVLHVGHLMVENRVDRITLSGDVDLTADQAGLAYAKQLQQLLAAVVATLEGRELPATLPPPPVQTVANPFE
ncbi:MULTISPECIES: hypothetical protein [unclassified Janthinobacterium]|uniref:hypothetical protein n=1 Tax=unclassified Janthinobacterium TaxID=2610881 RepID=UPI0003604D44|nr:MULTISPECIES: hypothetical protein [unclassified Janthinobacterium]MEC5161240.1 hypothetical protein [Janthinobacterium sp. CG_S6]